MKSLNSYPPLVTVFNFWTACTSLHWTDYVHHFCISKALQKQAGKRNWSSCPSQPSSHNHVLPECQLEQTKPICTHFGTATPTIAFSFNITLHHHSPSHLSMVNSTKLCAKLITDLFCRKKFKFPKIIQNIRQRYCNLKQKAYAAHNSITRLGINHKHGNWRGYRYNLCK